MAASSPRKTDRPPSSADVKRMLGPAFAAWEALLDPARGRTTEWKRYRPEDPWALRVFEGKRTVLWVRPVEGELRATVIVGNKAVAAGLAGRLSERLKKALREAPAYPEGRAVRFRLKSAARVRGVEQLIDLKVGRPGLRRKRRP
jgi:hypothetical protein